MLPINALSSVIFNHTTQANVQQQPGLLLPDDTCHTFKM